MTVALLGSLDCAQQLLNWGLAPPSNTGKTEFCVESAHDTTRWSGTAADELPTPPGRVVTTRGVVALRCIFPRTFSLRLYHFRGAMRPALGRSGLVTPPKTRLSRTALQFPNFQDGCQAETMRDIVGNRRDDVGPKVELLSLMRARVLKHFYPGNEQTA